MEKQIKNLEKKSTKVLEDATKQWETQLSTAQKAHAKDTKRADAAEILVQSLQEEIVELKKKVKEMGTMGKEMEDLKIQAGEAVDAKKRCKEAEKVAEQMTIQYKEESVLRKRYFNMMEDMKGKVRTL